jgi:riboflavin synthase
MFTGLVETVGNVKSVRRKGDIFEMAISAPAIVADLSKGQSVSVSGACLSVVSIGISDFSVEMMPETVKGSTLGNLKTGDNVNLERALQINSRFEGHIVSGHVDAVGRIKDLKSSGQSTEMYISAVPEQLDQIVRKGSVAVDGVSLTVIDVFDSHFSVGLIPTTIKDTTLGSLSKGDSVNLETDILAKYVNKLLFPKNAVGNQTNSKVTWDALSELGWTSS